MFTKIRAKLVKNLVKKLDINQLREMEKELIARIAKEKKTNKAKNKTTKKPATKTKTKRTNKPTKTPANSFEMLVLKNGNHILTGVNVATKQGKLQKEYSTLKKYVVISKWTKGNYYCFVNSSKAMKQVIKIVSKVSGFKYIGERAYKPSPSPSLSSNNKRCEEVI